MVFNTTGERKMPLKSDKIDKLVKEEQDLILELDKMKEGPEKDEKLKLASDKREERLRMTYDLLKNGKEQERDESQSPHPKGWGLRSDSQEQLVV